MKNLIFCIFAIYLAAGPAKAEDVCSLFVRNGLYARERIGSSAASQSSFKSSVLQTLAKIRKDDTKADASFKYNLTSGQGSYTRAELEAMESLFSSNLEIQTSQQGTLNIYREFVDPNALQSFNRCIDAESSGLKADIQMGADDDFEFVRVGVRYALRPDSSKYPSVDRVAKSFRNLSCRGKLTTAAKILNEWAYANCTRKLLAMPEPLGDGMKIANPASFWIPTTVGSTGVDLPAVVYLPQEVHIPGGDTEAHATPVAFPFAINGAGDGWFTFTSPLTVKATFNVIGQAGLLSPYLVSGDPKSFKRLDALTPDVHDPINGANSRSWSATYQIYKGIRYIIRVQPQSGGPNYPYRLGIALQR